MYPFTKFDFDTSRLSLFYYFLAILSRIGFQLVQPRMTVWNPIPLRSHSPDFFVNSGDVCYADNPIASELRLEDGVDLEEFDHRG